MDKNEVFQDDILHVSADLADKAQEKLGFEDKDWEVVYNSLIKTLNEIMGEPEYRSYL